MWKELLFPVWCSNFKLMIWSSNKKPLGLCVFHTLWLIAFHCRARKLEVLILPFRCREQTDAFFIKPAPVLHYQSMVHQRQCWVQRELHLPFTACEMGGRSSIKDLLKISDNRKSNFPLIHWRRLLFITGMSAGQNTVFIFQLHALWENSSFSLLFWMESDLKILPSGDGIEAEAAERGKDTVVAVSEHNNVRGGFQAESTGMPMRGIDGIDRTIKACFPDIACVRMPISRLIDGLGCGTGCWGQVSGMRLIWLHLHINLHEFCRNCHFLAIQCVAWVHFLLTCVALCVKVWAWMLLNVVCVYVYDRISFS